MSEVVESGTHNHDYSVTVPCPKLGETWMVTLARAGRLFIREFTIGLIEKDPSDPQARRFAYPSRSDRHDFEFVETTLKGTLRPHGVNVGTPGVPIPANWIQTAIAPKVSFWHPPELEWNGQCFAPKKDAKKG